MWTGNIKFCILADAGRWKVELFADSGEKPLTSSTLPMVQLGELFVESRLTTDPQMQPNEPFTYIGMENVQSGTGDLVGSTGCLGREIKSRSKVVMRDQVLYGRLRPNLNKVHHFTGEDGQFICSGEFIVLNARENVVRPKVLRELLSSKIVLDAVIKFIGGASLPRVSIADLASIRVPLPSMEDQMKFEKYVREIDTRRGNIKRELEEMPSHLETRLKEMLQINLVGEGVL